MMTDEKCSLCGRLLIDCNHTLQQHEDRLKKLELRKSLEPWIRKIVREEIAKINQPIDSSSSFREGGKGGNY